MTIKLNLRQCPQCRVHSLDKQGLEHKSGRKAANISHGFVSTSSQTSAYEIETNTTERTL